MNPDFGVPPLSAAHLTPPSVLVGRLAKLVGRNFPLTGKTRTDGSNTRKLVAAALEEFPLPRAAPAGSYRIVPPGKKGVPRILREFLDTYIVTSGLSYNLQVWNRNPNADSVQVEFAEGPSLLASDVRFVFVRVDMKTNKIRSVAILSPKYIVVNFGRFGRPTVKHQLIITSTARAQLLAGSPPIIFHSDEPSVAKMARPHPDLHGASIRDLPEPGRLVSLETIRDIVLKRIVGSKIAAAATKTRGQLLETLVAGLLGYEVNAEDFLAGGYPDIAHQALEVKVQDAPTVDLGKFSPQFNEPVPSCPGFTTRSLRYLIALTDAVTGVVKGAVVSPGSRLGEHFAFVADTSFKSQRSIPMSFFDAHDGKAVSDP